MRPVKVFKMQPINDLSNPERRIGASIKLEKVADGHGTFHQWGSYCEEFEQGPGNYTVAIIERPDGTIETIYPELIQFTDV